MDFSHILSDTYGLTLLGVGFVTLLYLALNYGLTFMRVGRTKRKPKPCNVMPSVSVVMVTHNQAGMLRQHLPILLEQDYPNYEIIVVDYHSKDDTEFVLQVCSSAYPNIKRVSIQSDKTFFKGKKYPLSIGIRSAKNDLIVLTDPECEPCGLEWLRSIVNAYDGNGVNIVLGATRLRTKANLLGHLQQYDNLFYNVSYLSAALSGHPYTGCGRNMSYKREFFFDNNGFISNYSEPDGADDMFVNCNATGENTRFTFEPDSVIEVESEPNFVLWSVMRRHRVITRCYYSLWRKIFLALRPWSLLLFYVACGLMYATPAIPWIIPSVILLLKLVWQVVCVAQSVKRFGLKGYHWFSPILELYFLVADTFLSIITLHRKRCNP